MRQVVPDKTEMQRFLERGLTQKEIADEWSRRANVSVTRSAIAMAIKRYELTPGRPRPRYDDVLPWRVRNEHKHHRDAKMLRLHGRSLRGRPLSPDEQRRLDNWRRLLDQLGAVVTYNPGTAEGCFLVRRDPKRDAEGDLIRRP